MAEATAGLEANIIRAVWEPITPAGLGGNTTPVVWEPIIRAGREANIILAVWEPIIPADTTPAVWEITTTTITMGITRGGGTTMSTTTGMAAHGYTA